ncbi:DUF1302 domain-containing protein [Pseudomonas sp. MT3]|uniref:DUF1302 domain-containing protein n=1 Tax=Pseudomonas sp. ATCC 13867 TaxID=1294143 RepID=UPI0002C4E98B|nr:DUF1302 domain-containing protein [Pseudomonas sp. ATCC 13867]AGI25843.1 type V secretory pathway, adhesin AidA [Pseudomonas sp. ATCC 13867]RFQ40635.1 DUF1302 domain-containing protein [Pseudomonas sp. ATCC 13867]
MTTKTRRGFFQPQLLATAVALGCATQAQAVSFNIGEIEGQFDSSLSVGASWSTQSPKQDLIGSANGGHGMTQTNDDGRLNFRKGHTFSKIFKGIHDLELKYGDFGVFTRGKYWYDFRLKDESVAWKDISDDGRKEGAKSSGAQLLDAFGYYNYSIAEMPGTVRLGKQVVSWGESTFIGNSINAINPIDVSAFRRPGSEIKEGLIPVNMLYLSQSLTDSLSVEGFYQLEWDQTVLDNCGTFFSTTDVAADGCNSNYNILDKNTVSALNAPATKALLNSLGVTVTPEGLMVPRGADRDARDSGQWGLTLRWLGDDVEYGAYAMNYHSRTPIVSMKNASAADIGNALTAISAGASALAQPILLGRGNYFLEYPEDIRLYGLSFSTTLPTGTAWNGEISYRPNMPLQLNTTDLTPLLATTVADGLASGGVPGALAQAGQVNHGYVRKEVTQAQTTFTHFFDQTLGADRVTVVGEVGVTYVGGMTNDVGERYGRDSVYGVPENAAADAEYGSGGFYTSSSWGYRARAIWDYNNVFAGVNLKPNVAWSHDVHGYGPVFNEGSKAASVGLDAEYQNTYTASLNYTNFFGGDYNTIVDRDFVSLSFGVNF